MSKLDWTNENVTYQAWLNIVKHYFSNEDMNSFKSVYQTFFPLFVLGLTVSEAISLGYIVCRTEQETLAIETIKDKNTSLNEKIELLVKARRNAKRDRFDTGKYKNHQNQS